MKAVIDRIARADHRSTSSLIEVALAQFIERKRGAESLIGATIIFLMGVCVGFLISDDIKDNWPRPKPKKPKKSKPAALDPLIKSAVEAIRHAEQEAASLRTLDRL